MSERERNETGSASDREEQPRKGVNLALIYGLIALAMLAAIALAALVVTPFYRHR